MNQASILKNLMLFLLIGAVVLPVALGVVVGLAALLSAMGDAAGGSVLHWIGLAIGILWIINLVAMVLLQAVNSLGQGKEQDHNVTDRRNSRD